MDPLLSPSVCRLRFIRSVFIGLGLVALATDSTLVHASIVPNNSEKSDVLWRGKRAPRRDAFRENGREIWPLPIGYYLDGTHSSVEVGLIKTALDQWQNLTCLRFVELKNATSSVTTIASTVDQQVVSQPHLQFTAISNEGPDMNCFTRSIGPTKYTGKGRPRARGSERRRLQRTRRWDHNRGTVVTLTRKCLSSKAAVGKIVHELGHVLAFFTHEHQRPDRDVFIEIVWSNIDPRMKSQFNLEKPEDLDTRFPYDYSSIMHYEGQAFSRGRDVDGHPLTTIRATDELFQRTMGQRVRLSFYDVKYANHIYCNHFCPAEGVASQCLHGGYSDPKNCSKCICPDGFGGSLCDSIPVNSPECLAAVNRIIVSSREEDDPPQCIASPNYNHSAEKGASYPLFLTCIWHLSAASGCRVDLRFQGRVQLKTRMGSCQHWVEVKLRRNKEQAGPRFCDSVGSSLGRNGTLSSEDNLVVVIFQSHYDVDPNDRLDGFRLCFSLGKCDDDDVTPAEARGIATEILAEESSQTESTGLEGTTNRESQEPEELHSETGKNNAETLESDKLRLFGGIFNESEGKQLLESAISEPSETNHPKNTKSRDLDRSVRTELTTLELSGSSDTMESRFKNGKFTDLPIRITQPIKLQLREKSEYDAPHELDGMTNSHINELHELKRMTNISSEESLEHIELNSRSNTGVTKSVKSESTTNIDLNESFESERLTSLGPDESIALRNDNKESTDSLKSESDVSNEFGKSPEVQTTVKSELYEPFELESWINDELQGLKTTENNEKYEPATSITAVVNGVQQGSNKSSTGMKAQRKFLVSEEALVKDVASETVFQMSQQDDSTIRSTLTSQVTSDVVRTLLASYGDKSNVQKKFMHSNQSLYNAKELTNASSVNDARFAPIFFCFIFHVLISRARHRMDAVT